MSPSAGQAIDALARFAEPWHRAFGSSVTIATAVLFTHVSSMVCGGGLMLAADRTVLFPSLMDLNPSERERLASAVTRSIATRALVVTAASGMLLFLSDVSSFSRTPIFWTKMGLVALLIVNARLTGRSQGARFRAHAKVSVALWLLTLLAGTRLVAG